MKKIVATVCFLLALIALVLVPATAYASPPTAVSGTITFFSRVVVDVRQADGNTIVTDILLGDGTGTFAGPVTFERKRIIHSNGQFNVHGIMTISPATVNGRSGTITARINATGVMTTPTTGPLQGQWVIFSGTGDLTSLHGQGAFEGTAGVTSTYSGQIHFDPD